ncbi:conjugal transfer protein TraD [Brucella cytisi]|jgi:hypothetical protein|uniref:Conjugal transfer protein TraD n=2 Tax=Brucella cytisi TaxID=407152 RepID=A0A1J6HP66_9HYPH|nr:conjugal transfer protein TraD [Brucella cytisi]OIS94185.1 conjugal transfer protein TraD [Brucella cytisi]
MARMKSTYARRQDAREKIELGGLIVQAGLGYEKRIVLIGLLIDAKNRIDVNALERSRLMTIGQKVLDDGTW